MTLSRQQFLKTAAAVPVLAALPAWAAGPVLTKPIPKTGEKLPMMGLGTSASYASTTDQAIINDVVKAFLDGGGTLIDTAPSYSKAEEMTGQAVADLGLRKKAFLATKLNTRGKESGIASFNESFKRLKTDVIDLMQVHNLVDTDTHLATMREWKQAGKFRYIGITHWREAEQEQLADVMAKHEIDFVQLNYSLDVRAAEKRLLPLAQEKGIAVLANVPLGRGKLLEAVKGKELPSIAKDLGCESFAQLLLKFVISHPAINAAIPATSKTKHIADNLGAATGRLPDAKQREQIVAFWESV